MSVFLSRRYFTTNINKHTHLTRSTIDNLFKITYNKIFYNCKTDKPLDPSLEYALIRSNLFFINTWFVINCIRNNKEIKALRKLYYVFIVKRLIRIYNRKKIMYLFDDNYNKQVLDELNRNANAVFIGLDDYFSENVMKRELKDIINQDILCEKFLEDEGIYLRYSKYILDKVKIDDIFSFLEKDFDLNNF